ncbi:MULTISPECIES: alpha-1,4-glucan--maltose-1-phosphate maltosyltransferase [Cryobacterium]|uniref:Alpha-1,4-glucan:maltose-1-phosphate maltosyltransferase n=1 Tax=Cryobacterium breve TaxID=1259258 RepID=A0ABY2J668_9MICO|nr:MULTISPECIES: alpha-1,4-glucan--maltose-1-phosphate maltosyltransferase [Cryobacterium]TFC95869.1 alpha-1,4-glucan--maltose-1-phosphate maltosyltransferase [Cryobacterium sp. TmT3-12]TFD00433.1 alpha-1,4-glucan--maltose-1-phosphate maltosyltransferase [Cryobacterium breve]
MLDLSPQLNDNLWPAKAFVGEAVPFAATAFREGHDLIGAMLLLTAPDGTESQHPMSPGAPGTDRWEALVTLGTQGRWTYRVRAYADDWATWRHNASLKIPAEVDVELTFLIGSALLTRESADKSRPLPERRAFTTAAKTLIDPAGSIATRFAVLSDPKLNAAAAVRPMAGLESVSEPRTVLVERTRAGVGSWYEFFPRSEGAVKRADGSWQSGTFRTAADRLPAVAAMGFDVLYLPPIHPIGRSFRKGPNNTLNAGPNDPGSPWAIGSADGGHDAIHPDLGTVADFQFFLAAARDNGLEIALDLALQASPDHPWVTEHPEWFTTLPDGSIAYAENPPKKYQDIYPVNFDNDPLGIRAEVLRVVRHWIGLGVSIFRVDNPHTKPLDFWEWLIHEVNAEFPDVFFLAEAFTRPALLQGLGKVGFQQSYTYFTWRNTKEELSEFFEGLAHETADFLRPNLFVNTPDILSEYLQFGGPAAFKIRAALAATAAPTWGVYTGFDLFESVARPGAEENIDNEKYQYRPRDFDTAEAAGASLAPYLTRLNRIRSEHPALGQLRNLDIHSSEDNDILVYSKFLDAPFTGTGQADALIIVANVDPHSVRQTVVHLDVTRFGLPRGSSFEVEDLITGAVWTWSADNFVRLDAFTEPVHILHVKGPTQ